MEWITTGVLSIICLMVTQLTGVSAANSDIVGIAVASCISFFLLSIVIAIIVVSFQWTPWFNRWMRQRGKVRMPKAYFKKKEEAKKRLIAASSAASHTSEFNGKLPAQSIDRGQEVRNHTHNAVANHTNHAIANHAEYETQVNHAKYGNGIQIQAATVKPTQNTTSWVQGWHQRTNGFANKVYEEKDVTMELGEEDNDEFKIETVLVDNEVLDVGPFRNDHSKEVPVKGDVYSEPYIYSTVDTTKKSSVRGDNTIDTEIVTTTTAVVTSEETQVTTGDGLVYL